MVPAGKDKSTPQAVSRRRLFIKGAGLGAALLASTFLRRSSLADSAPMEMEAHAMGLIGVPRAPFDRDAMLVEPEVRTSAGGELGTTLRVGYAYKDIGGYRLSLRTYEGDIPGPTLRVRPATCCGSSSSTTLPPNPDPTPVEHDAAAPLQHDQFPLPRRSRRARRHRRQHLPLDGAGRELRHRDRDSRPIIRAAPTGTIRTTMAAPTSRSPGGMAGALIIEGDFDDVPEVAAAAERVLILNEVLFDYRGTIENYDTVWPEAVPRFLVVNGQREPVIRMRPGEVQRWRIVAWRARGQSPPGARRTSRCT